ncbi:MAG: ISL3 family transposase [Candidatus Acidiferrales bacterium]
MRDTELYRALLGLESPWTVARVDLDVKEQRVDVYAEHGKRKTWPCPECEAPCGLHDHDEERAWRHLDSCQFKTVLHARIPRVRCRQHGVLQVRVPWADPGGRFTALFERWAIEVLHETSVEGGGRLLGISWDEAHHIMQRAVERGLARREPLVPKHLGLDEKSIRKGSRFATIATDIQAGAVIEVAEGRTKESVYRSLGSYSLNDLAEVEAVAIDMSQTYINAVRACIKSADEKIVFDRFHVVQHMTDAVDKVRRGESQQLREEGDDRLVGSRYFWLYGRENVPDKHLIRFDTLRNANLKTARAWAIKEQLRDLWNQPALEDGEAWWRGWFGWASHSRLEPVKKVARMIKRHLPNVLTYFTHRITSATNEALNGVIKTLIKRSYGFRSFPNFRTAVLFHCGKLDLYPATC